MTYNEMDDIHTNWHHCTNVKELKIDGRNISTIADLNKTIYVSKLGSDETGNGSLGNPFLTIGHANDIAISQLNPVVDWNECIIIKVSTGKYTEHLTQAHRRVYIEGSGKDFENWTKGVIIYNTGADADHYPIDPNFGLNLSDITVMVDSGGVYGKLIDNALFSLCGFEGGCFIENPTIEEHLTMYFNFCYIGGSGFNLTGEINYGRFIALRRCDLWCTDPVFSTTGTGSKTIKFDSSMMGSNLLMSGNWNGSVIDSEIYGNGKLTFDTNGWVDIFASTIVNGIHFTSDTPLTKKLVNCIFKDTPTGEGDVTADEAVEFIEYSGNHQCNGIDGEVITVSKIKNVGGGQNNYRNIHEALKGSVLQDTIINLEGDVEIDSPLIINPNIDVQIDGNKKWKLTSTHATTLCELGVNQHLSFVNLKQIIGGKKLIVNGNNAQLSLVSCGRYTEPNYVNIEITAGNIESFVYLVKSTIIGTAAQPISVNNINPWLVIDRSFIKGSSGQPAIEWTVDADSRFRVKYTTLIHGSGSTNSPLLNSDPGNGDITLSMYNCAMNAVFPPSDFTNNIGNPNNTIDPQIDY